MIIEEHLNTSIGHHGLKVVTFVTCWQNRFGQWTHGSYQPGAPSRIFVPELNPSPASPWEHKLRSLPSFYHETWEKSVMQRVWALGTNTLRLDLVEVMFGMLSLLVEVVQPQRCFVEAVHMIHMMFLCSSISNKMQGWYSCVMRHIQVDPHACSLR